MVVIMLVVGYDCGYGFGCSCDDDDDDDDDDDVVVDDTLAVVVM